jgi:hypothetical protein
VFHHLVAGIDIQIPNVSSWGILRPIILVNGSTERSDDLAAGATESDKQMISVGHRKLAYDNSPNLSTLLALSWFIEMLLPVAMLPHNVTTTCRAIPLMDCVNSVAAFLTQLSRILTANLSLVARASETCAI